MHIFYVLGRTAHKQSLKRPQGRLDPRGRLCCLRCPNKTWTLPFDKSDTLKNCQKWIRIEKVMSPQNCQKWIRIEKVMSPQNCQKWIRIKKVMAPKVEGIENSKITSHQTVTKPFPYHFLTIQKIPCVFTLSLLEFHDDLYNWKWHFYSPLNHFKWIRNKKVRSFESMRGSKESKKKRKNNVFCELKNLFFFWLFFHYSFSFALQRWILKLLVTLP